MSTEENASAEPTRQRQRRWLKLSGDTHGDPSQLRLEDDGDLIEIVDEQVTSRSPNRKACGVNGRVILTLAELVWLVAKGQDLIAARSPQKTER